MKQSTILLNNSNNYLMYALKKLLLVVGDWVIDVEYSILFQIVIRRLQSVRSVAVADRYAETMSKLLIFR